MDNKIEEVIQWLEAGDEADYRAGVLLLQERSGNRGLVNRLLGKESANHREKLRYELVKLGCEGRMEDVSEVLNHFAAAVAGAVQAMAMPFPAQPAPGQVPAAVQVDVDELTRLMQSLFNQRAQLSNSLADLPAADGPRVVGQILSLQNQYNALAEKRRRVIAGEAAPEPAAPEQPAPAAEGAPVVDRAELIQRRQNLRSSISKGKGKAKGAKTEAKRSEYEQKVGQLEVELATLEMQLALPQA